jgi:N-acetyltransferase
VTEGSLAGAVSACRRSGAAGGDLVDQASRLVHDRFTTYSVLHVWERPETAFRRRRGYCTQYNGALAQILCRLGFDASMVYTARVRFDDNAEWALGHAWVRVRLDGEVRDVCARSASNRPGSVGFTCLRRVRRLGRGYGRRCLRGRAPGAASGPGPATLGGARPGRQLIGVRRYSDAAISRMSPVGERCEATPHAANQPRVSAVPAAAGSSGLRIFGPRGGARCASSIGGCLLQARDQ